MVEHQSYKLGVTGSSPVPPTSLRQGYGWAGQSIMRLVKKNIDIAYDGEGCPAIAYKSDGGQFTAGAILRFYYLNISKK